MMMMVVMMVVMMMMVVVGMISIPKVTINVCSSKVKPMTRHYCTYNK